MKIAFRTLLGSGTPIPRPILDVYVGDVEDVGISCLVDTGSIHNRFGLWVAEIAGIDVSDARLESLAVGGRPTIGRTLPTRLSIGTATWEAPVSFCDPWPWDFNLLGQEGFLRWFTITFRTADRELELEPITG